MTTTTENTKPVSSRVYKRTKILATLGPATDDYGTVVGLIRAGVNGFRLNFSHGDHQEHAARIERVRKASNEAGKPVAILQDLQGPKIRLGDFDGEIAVHKGQELRLDFNGQYDGANTFPIQYDLSQKVKADERLYIFDGRVRTTVLGVEPGVVIVRVENDGVLLKRKGINLPDTDFGGDILTEKDLRDIDFGVTQDIDYIAMSFIQTAADVAKLRDILKEKGADHLKIISKIETQAAISEENLEPIVQMSDGVMVARGDLAVETSPEIVPIVQRRILQLAQQHERISIVATQMLLSMVNNPEPTRAEVSDVANAVICGADCVMLSDETTIGKYPLETIATMKRIILYTQENEPVKPLFYSEVNHTMQDAISSAAVTLAHQVKARAIVAETKSGNTATSIAAHRPGMPIITVTSDRRVAQQLTLMYANKTFLRPDGEHAGLDLAKELRSQDFFDANSTVVLVSGRQPGLTGGTDTIRVRVLA